MIDTRSSDTRLLEPPVELQGFHKNDWFAIPPVDSVIVHLADQLWEHPERPQDWEAARLSKAAYLSRERASGWLVLVKFYAAKVRSQVSARRNRPGTLLPALEKTARLLSSLHKQSPQFFGVLPEWD